ncbi:MAG: radical SAM protein, partial [Nitrosopumilus sp.]
MNTCTHRCVWCWRDIDFTKPKWTEKVDDPKFIVDECIKEFVRSLEGYHGYKKVDKKKLSEIHKPQQFAISLSGEPTMYPKLPELILELKKRKINSFLVTNGTNPSMLKKLIEKKAQPTQLYITLPAPDEQTYIKVCNPLIKNSWKKILKSLELINKFKRNVVRLTLTKDINMDKVEKYV